MQDRRRTDENILQLCKDIEVLKTRQADCRAGVKEDTQRILTILEGNGGAGLVTKVALNGRMIKIIWGAIVLVLGGMVTMALK